MFSFSISTWSMRQSLGPLRWTIWNEETKRQEIREEWKPQELELTDLPMEAKRNGLSYLEVCHFQIPSTDAAYLAELRASFESAGIGFLTLLVDYGDISSPDAIRRESDIAYLRGWIEAAAKAGAAAVRVVAGEQPADDAAAIARSCSALKQLAQYGAERGVRVVTENFRPLTATLSSWSSIMSKVGSIVPTIIDFGNFQASEKANGISYGASMAHSIHAKPNYLSDGSVDAQELGMMLRILKDRGCSVPLSIIADKGDTRWDQINTIKSLISEA